MNDNRRVICTAEIDGLPQSVNHLWARGRRGSVFKTQRAKEWENCATFYLSAGRTDKTEPYEGDVLVDVTFHVKGKRRRDIDNMQKSLLDCLMSAGVIRDDSQICEINARRCVSDKNATNIIVFRKGN